jgi:hypothetical protein
MLGGQVGEETGQVTGIRVLPDEGAGLRRVEVSWQTSRDPAWTATRTERGNADMR